MPLPSPKEGIAREQLQLWMEHGLSTIQQEFHDEQDIVQRTQQLRESLDLLIHEHCPALACECEEYLPLQKQMNRLLATIKRNATLTTDHQILLSLRREYHMIVDWVREKIVSLCTPLAERTAGKKMAGGKRREDSISTRIRACKTPEHYLSLFRELGIPSDEWRNSRWLERTCQLPPQEGGIGKKLAHISQYIRNVAGFESFPAFVAWMEGKGKPDDPFTERVRASATPKDFQALFQSIGIPEGKWEDRKWLDKVAHLPPEQGGIGKKCSGVVRAISKDHRFGGYPAFVRWMYGDDAPGSASPALCRNMPKMTERVRECTTREDFFALFSDLGILGENWRKVIWLCQQAALPPAEGGIGKSMSRLVSAIAHDSRFKKYTQFIAWMDGKQEPPKSWTKKVRACETRADFLHLFEESGVPGVEWRNSNWLGQTARKSIEEGGIGKNLVALVGAIRLDLRFQSYPKFVAWMDGKEKPDESWKKKISRCVSREDFQHLFEQTGIPQERWKVGAWLATVAPLPPEEGGINRPLAALVVAIREDCRFQSYPRFVAWMDGEELSADFARKQRQRYAERIRACIKPEDFIQYFRELGIHSNEWKNCMHFRRASEPIELGGVGRIISGVPQAIAADPRFKSYRKFVAWMEGKADREPSNRERIAACKTPQDFLGLFSQLGVPTNAWRNSRWFTEVAKLPPERGGIGKKGLTTIPSILADRFGSYSDFVAWMEGRDEVEDFLVVRVRQCQTREDFLGMFKEVGVEDNRWKSGQWLRAKSTLPPSEGGVGRCLVSINRGIVYDPRFGSQRKFVAWMEGREELDNEILASEVRRCRSQEDYFELFSKLGITGGKWRSFQWLARTAAQPVGQGGIGRAPEGFILAIREKFGSLKRFILWMDGSNAPQEPWRERIAPLETPDEFLAFFEELEIPDELWRNSDWLSKRAILSRDEGGIGMPLQGLATALRERFVEQSRFVMWMDGRTESEPTMTARVLACKTREEFLHLFAKLDIPDEKWKEHTWRVKIARLPPEQGGIGRNLVSLAGIIAEHPQFESFPHFVAWMEGKEKPPLSLPKQVANCRTREDFLQWFIELGIPGDRWRDGTWLTQTAHRSIEEGGIGKTLSGIPQALRQDERFGTFPQFVAWMEGKEKAKESMPQRIRQCHTPENFLLLFEELGIPADKWRNTNWLRNIARLPPEKGGARSDFTVLCSAIHGDGRFPTYHDFIAWMDGIPPEGITSVDQALSLLEREATRLETSVEFLLNPSQTPQFIRQSVVLHRILKFFHHQTSQS